MRLFRLFKIIWMMVNLKQIRDAVIDPTLQAIGLHSPEAVDLVLFTGVQESGYKYLKQLGTGPALSFWQIEPDTLDDIFENYLKYREGLAGLVEELIPEHLGHSNEFPDFIEAQLVTNLAFAVAMSRLVYRRSPLMLPAVGDGPGMAHIWKKVYNTPKGAGTEDEFLRNWENAKGQLF